MRAMVLTAPDMPFQMMDVPDPIPRKGEAVARGELWPFVTETFALQNVEELHQRLENGLVVGRAAVLINP